MREIPDIKSVMTPSPLHIDIGEPVRTAQDMMIDHEIRHLPVTDSGVLVGVLSDRDIAFMSIGGARPDVVDHLRVRDVCSFEVYTVGPDEPLAVVLREMAERRIGSTIITDEGRIVGLFTATDACRCFAEFLEPGGPGYERD
jgi:acetoin utilization protein AcuB